MAVIISAPTLSSHISYDFRYDYMAPALPAYWYALQFITPDTKDSSTGGYVGFQQYGEFVNSPWGPQLRFSMFGTDASNPIAGIGGAGTIGADGGAGAATYIPFNIIQGINYHIDIYYQNKKITTYVTDPSTGDKSFVGSIYVPNMSGFTGAYLWEEQYTPASNLTQIANSQATFSSILFDNYSAIFNPNDANSVYIPTSIGSVTNIEQVFIIYGNSYSIKVGSNNSDTINISNLDSHVYLNSGNYTVNGGNGNDYVKATAGNVHLNGGAGDDTFVGGSGTNIIDGGTGTNTVNFQGNQSEYTITNNSGVITVIDSKSNRDGTDTLSNIQCLNFQDKTLYLGPDQITAPTLHNYGIAPTNTDSKPMIYGDADPYNTVTIYDNGSRLGSITTDQYGQFTFRPSTSLASGIHALTALQENSYGQTSSISSPLYLPIGNIIQGSGVLYPTALDNNIIGSWNTFDTCILPGLRGNYLVGFPSRNVDGGISSLIINKLNASPTEFSYLALAQIEKIQFADGSLIFDISQTNDNVLVYRLYQAAFARSPDEGGFRFWIDQHANKGLSFESMSSGFIGSPEFKSKYGTNPTNAQLVDLLYLNVLGRHGETAGVTWWNNELNTSHQSREQVLLGFASSPENVTITAANIDNAYWIV